MMVTMIIITYLIGYALAMLCLYMTYKTYIKSRSDWINMAIESLLSWIIVIFFIIVSIWFVFDDDYNTREHDDL